MPAVSESSLALRALRKRTGLSLRELAALIGWKPTTYQRYEYDFHKQHLPAKLIHALIPVFQLKGISQDELWPLAGLPAPKANGVERPEQPPAKSEVDFKRATPLPASEDDLPIWGRVKGGTIAAVIDTSEAGGWTERPRGLADVADAAAAYVPDDSMAPRYEPGEVVVVHPRKTLTRGCYVLIEHDDQTAILRRYLKGDDDHIQVERFNPPERKTIARSRIRSLYRIIRSGEE